MTRFIKQLEKIRKEKKLSKYQIAKKSGIARSQINNYYRGTKPTKRTIEKIAIGLGIDPDYFDDYKINRAIKILEKNPALLDEVLLKANHHKTQAQDYILC